MNWKWKIIGCCQIKIHEQSDNRRNDDMSFEFDTNGSIIINNDYQQIDEKYSHIWLRNVNSKG